MTQNDDLVVKMATHIVPESNIGHIYADDDDSYIYGDADATLEDTIETMTVYDPDAERYEEIELTNPDEVVNCYAYSRKTC